MWTTSSLIKTAVLFIFALSFCFFRVQSTDVYMYLALARDFVLQGNWSFQDPYLYSLPGAHLDWVHEYLSYLLFYAAWTVAGVTGLIVTKALILTAMFMIALTARPQEKNASLLWIALWTTAVIAASFRFIERSSLISDLFTVLLARWLLENHVIDRRFAIRLSVLFLAWIQFHPAFPLGLGLLAVWLIWNLIINPQLRLRDLALLAAPLLILFINPCFIDGVTYPFRFALEQTPVLKHFNYEWFPAYHPAFRWAPEVIAFWFLGALSFYLVAREKSWLSLRTWFVAFALIMGAMAVRFIPWAAFVIVMAIKPWTELKQIRVRPWITSAVLGILLLVALKNFSIGYYSSSGPRTPGFQIDAAHFPTATLEFLKTRRIQGHLYNTHEFGAYLAWEQVLPLFHHGFVTDMDFYRNDVMGVFQSQERFLELAKKYNWTMLLVDKAGGYPYFFKILSPLKEWRIVAEDEASYLIYYLP